MQQARQKPDTTEEEAPACRLVVSEHGIQFQLAKRLRCGKAPTAVSCIWACAHESEAIAKKLVDLDMPHLDRITSLLLSCCQQ